MHLICDYVETNPYFVALASYKTLSCSLDDLSSLKQWHETEYRASLQHPKTSELDGTLIKISRINRRRNTQYATCCTPLRFQNYNEMLPLKNSFFVRTMSPYYSDLNNSRTHSDEEIVNWIILILKNDLLITSTLRF